MSVYSDYDDDYDYYRPHYPFPNDEKDEPEPELGKILITDIPEINLPPFQQ